MVVAILSVLVIDATTTASRAATKAYLQREFGLAATLSVPVAGESQALQVYAAMGDDGLNNRSLIQTEQLLVVRGESMFRTNGELTLKKSGTIRPDDVLVGSTRVEPRSNLAQVVLDESTLSPLGLTREDAVGSSVGLADLGSSSQFDFAHSKMRRAVVVAVHATPPDGGPITRIIGGASVTSLPTSVQVRASEHDADLVTQIAQTVAPSLSANRLDHAAQLAPVEAQDRRVGRALSILALTIGGLGLLTTRISIVRERRVELGIRRAIGATRTDIVVSVLSEALVVTAIAAAIALGLASIIFPLLPPDLLTQGSGSVTQLTLPASSVVGGVASAALIGLIGGLIPAAMASKTAIVDAVRR